jgi:3D (Asp-Asp-Asp) domain-containing protein
VIFLLIYFSLEPIEPVKTKNTAPEVAPVIEVVPEITETKTSLGVFKITAYCPCSKCCGKWSDGITATGVTAKENHTIAVDPDVIPLGSTVEINGNKYVADDVGGAIKGNKIDIFYGSHSEALTHGVQSHEVYLVEEV